MVRACCRYVKIKQFDQQTAELVKVKQKKK